MFCYDCGVIYITVYPILLRYKYSISTVCMYVCRLMYLYLSIYLSVPIYLSICIYLSVITLCYYCYSYCTPQTSASPIMSLTSSQFIFCSHLFKIVKSLTLDMTSFDGILCLLSIETINFT